MTMCQMDMTYLRRGLGSNDPNGQPLIILPRTFLPADGLMGLPADGLVGLSTDGLVGRPTSCGETFKPGAKPGLISSGVRLGCAWAAGSDCVGVSNDR